MCNQINQTKLHPTLQSTFLCTGQITNLVNCNRETGHIITKVIIFWSSNTRLALILTTHLPSARSKAKLVSDTTTWWRQRAWRSNAASSTKGRSTASRGTLSETWSRRGPTTRPSGWWDTTRTPTPSPVGDAGGEDTHVCGTLQGDRHLIRLEKPWEAQRVVVIVIDL